MLFAVGGLSAAGCIDYSGGGKKPARRMGVKAHGGKF